MGGSAATLLTPAILIAIVAVVGLQLIPADPLDWFQTRIEVVRPVVLGVGLAIVIAFAGATVPSQGVPPFIYFRF